MKLRLILFSAMLAIYSFANAQNSNETFDFDKAVDFMNCKSIELSLKKSQTSGVFAQFQDNCICQDNPSFNSIKSSIPSSETRTIELASEIDKIKTSENRALLLKPDVAIVFLTENVFLNKTKYSKLFDFANKRKDDPAFKSLKTELKKDLLSRFSLQPQSNISTPPNSIADQQNTSSIEERISILERPEPKVEDKSWFDGITFQIDIFSIIISLVLMFLIFKIISGSLGGGDVVSESIKHYVKQKISETKSGAVWGNTSGVSNSEFRTLKDEIEKLKAEIKDLSYKIESSKIPLEIVQPNYDRQSRQESKQSEIKAPTETFYLSTPNSDGSFNESSAQSSYREGASIYKFTKISSSKAEFQIDEREASIKLALQYPDKNIDPVCEAQNAFNPKATRLSTVQGGSGKAELIGDKWILNCKTKIRYEN